MAQLFSVQVYFLVFREVLESAVIVSVLLSFLKRGFADPATAIARSSDDSAADVTEADPITPKNSQVYRNLRNQVWAGAFLGVLTCFVIGGLFVAAFYLLGSNAWARTEKLWEAFFCILASVMITVLAKGMLRLNRMQSKYRLKFARMIIDSHVANHKQEAAPAFSVIRSINAVWRKYAMATLPFVTTLREGLEAVAFLGGLGASQPASTLPLSVLLAAMSGVCVGWLLYRYGTSVGVRYFCIGSTCFLYLVAAGLFSRGVWFYEAHQFISRVGQDVSESGSGPGSYDITRSVWHVNCCNPETDGIWMIFNGLFGWQNSATYGSVISYNLYWLVVIMMLLRSRLHEQRLERKLGRPDADEEAALIDRAARVVRSHY